MNNTNDGNTIQIGIDLGTTNSEIAYSINGNIDILKDPNGQEFVPSVFGITKGGNKMVGRNPYNKLIVGDDEDLANIREEVKRLMGKDENIYFSRIDKNYLPEEVSAEILKYLRQCISRKYPDAKQVAAVITVPAHFESLQCEATKRAGLMAGFDYIELVQEPIAAAISYGYDKRGNSNILVYDLGGGTFDVALISSTDGMLKVVEHGGDNHLGGKDIDNSIVEEVFYPTISASYNIKALKNDIHFKRKLKAIAEEAKIGLTSEESVYVELDGLGVDDDGKEIRVEFNYARTDFNKLIEPIIRKTIEVANKVITDSHISKSNIDKIVYVGGPTQIPYLRSEVNKALGLEPDYSVDPLTVVARGACVYGLGRRIPHDIVVSHHEKKNSQEVVATLNYEAMTSEEDEMITGSLALHDDDEYHIRITSNNGAYSSADILVKNGKFYDTVTVKPGCANKYNIELFNSKNEKVPVFPDSFTITHGLVVGGIPIPNDIGVIYAEKSIDSDFAYVEKCEKYFERNSNLPLEDTHSFKTVRLLEKDSENPLDIKIYEGNSNNPRDNKIITGLKIDGSQIPHNLLKGTEVELTIKVDESRNVSAEVYVPSIDLVVESEFVRIDVYDQEVNEEEIKEEVKVQRNRLAESDVSEHEKESISAELDSIEKMVSNHDDTDSKQKADNDIKKVRQKLDEIDSASTLDRLTQQFKKTCDEVGGILEEATNEDPMMYKRYSELYNMVCSDGNDAIKAGDKYKLLQAIDNLRTIRVQVLAESPYFWLEFLRRFKQDKNIVFADNLREAEFEIEAAERAVENNDVNELKLRVRRLMNLLPAGKEDEMMEGISGITK